MQIQEQFNKLILQQIQIGKYNKVGNITMFFIIEKAKETKFEFPQETVKVS